ncbi:uncharacterized protein J4E79_010970 [Alternaria viburni]|uniref:uncharacterized protein n=1 Tax=Alternaria viburni TaxID=566460 RepID=UPI0020C505AA|nr:uncharacterized protein J4E79_010970 [Alternaria viburni]KAI4644835.1 hypothetical protein J4E79_010970 [Alternaria viburni]
MVNLVTMVERSEPTDIYHIVYELAAYDLNVFLTTMRYDLRKIRHATASPERTGSVNMWPGDLISESVNLADALDYLHNRLISSKLHSSLSHNDIKPENILVVYPETTSDRELYPVGQWKLADFGLSKMKVKRSSGGHSRHLSAGNPPFLSSYPQRTHRTERPKSVSNDIPERYPGMYTAPELDQETPREADCRNADVWSFGCVLSEIVTYAVNLDFQQVVSFRDSLLQSSPADSKFYNKRSKDVKSEFIDHLARLPNTTQSITRISSNALWTNQCVDLIRKIVVKEPGNRLGPSKIREKLSQIGQAMHSGREEWLKHSPPPPLTVDISAANTEMAVSCPTSIMSQSPTEYTNPDHEREGPITRIPSITIHPVEHASSDPIQAPHSKETSTQAIYQGVEAGGRTISNFGDTIGNYRGRTLFDSSRRKEDIVDKVLGVEHPDTLTSTANLASTFWYQKRLEEAEKLEGPRPQSQDEKMPTETQCCHNASQRHILTDMSRELIETPESIYGLLPDSLKSGVQFDTNGLSGQFPGTWTCRPLDDNEPASYPLTIAGAPVTIDGRQLEVSALLQILDRPN